jgi:hypothetical protein
MGIRSGTISFSSGPYHYMLVELRKPEFRAGPVEMSHSRVKRELRGNLPQFRLNHAHIVGAHA